MLLVFKLPVLTKNWGDWPPSSLLLLLKTSSPRPSFGSRASRHLRPLKSLRVLQRPVAQDSDSHLVGTSRLLLGPTSPSFGLSVGAIPVNPPMRGADAP